MIHALMLAAIVAAVQGSAAIKVTGDWQVQVTTGGKAVTLTVEPPVVLAVTGEKIDSLPVFNPNAGGWAKGAQLRAVRAQETTTPGLLDPASLVLRAGPDPDSQAFEKGRDYDADLFWGTVGRLPGGRIGEGQPVYASYRHALLRLDSVVHARDGAFLVRKGEARAAAPGPPSLLPGEQRVANIWIPGRIERLTDDNLFPILATAFPEPRPARPSVAERLLPKTMAKLTSGQPLRILAWGDSVTDAGYLPDPPRDRWQEQFAARLRLLYPTSRIELVTEAWGGRNTASYLGEPPGSPHNYREKVLGAKPDLVVSEFVNDAGLNPEQVEERYSKLLADFQAIGAEWIVLTPHYVRPDWMNLNRERDIDQDPRPYVAGLRQFAAKHGVALADASLRWGRLWRQGIPYTSLLLNSINHPNAQGMELFARSLIALFPWNAAFTPADTRGASLASEQLSTSRVLTALRQIYAGKLDPDLLTPALRARMTAAKVKSLSGSMRQYGAPKSPRLVSLRRAGDSETATIRVLLGETSFIVTAVLAPDNRLDDLKFIEE